MFRYVEMLIQDLRYAIRMMIKSPWFTTVTVLSLAIGIGANTAIFSLVDAVMLKRLPVKNPEQLFFLRDAPLSSGLDDSLLNGPTTTFSYHEYEAFRDHNDIFSGLAAYRLTDRVSASNQGHTQLASAQIVSGNYFSVLGVGSLMGRTLTEDDDRPGADPGVVISDRYWQRQFGGDVSTIGKTLNINNTPFTIIGVTPPEFFGLEPGEWPDITMPMAARKKVVLGGDFDSDSSTFAQLIGRLRPDRNVQQALARLAVIYQGLLEERVIAEGQSGSPEKRAEILSRRVELIPGGRGLSWVREQVSKPLLVIMGLVAFVLIVACINASVMLLARNARRQKEIAIRLTLGASRARLTWQLLTESILLSMFGGVAGIFVAYWGTRILLQGMVIGPNPISLAIEPDLRVLLFTTMVSFLSGLLFGLIPAVRATRLDLTPAIKENSSGSIGGRRRLTLGRVLIVAQVTMSLLMLITAGLFVHTLQNLKGLNLGIASDDVLLVSVDPGLVGYKEGRVTNLYKGLQERFGGLPGVRSASFSAFSPLGQIRGIGMVTISGYTPSSDEDLLVSVNKVGPGYFETVGIPLMTGRSISGADTTNAPKVAVINRSMARKYFPDENPIGKLITLRLISEKRDVEIIGVVEDSKYSRVQDTITPTAYTPQLQDASPGKTTYALRVGGDPLRFATAVRREVENVDSNIPIFDLKTIAEQIDYSLAQERLIAQLSGFFGVVAMFLVCLGLFGVLSYEVERRGREIGIRMALGETRGSIVWKVMREALLLVLLGVIMGISIALWATPLISSLLYGLTPTDPATLALAVAIMVAVALIAAFLPAKQASSLDPALLLRRE